MKKEPKAILIVIDGWGVRRERDGNAIAQARTPHYTRLLAEYPNTQLEASGLPVGLPAGVMGNSEVGHMNIGSGRRVVQDQVRIHDSITDDTFFTNPVLREAMNEAKRVGRLHLMGLVSQGNVHSAERHYLSLIAMAEKEKVPAGKVFVHAFLDGRDTPPQSARPYLQTLEDTLAKEGGRIATVAGRFYAMDRDKRWERTDQAYKAMVKGMGMNAPCADTALEAAYARGETDEFVLPTVIVGKDDQPIGRIESGDVVICFNFRPDRMRQMVRALTHNEAPIPSLDSTLSVKVICFTKYDATFNLPIAFNPQDLSMSAGEVISKGGFSQFRTAETEKYAHVTYFFNGGREVPFEGEDRLMIPSPKVRTYDLQPEMSSKAVTRAVVDRARLQKNKLIVVNFAQADMVGHTGIFDAALAAVESVDWSIGEIVGTGLDSGFDIFITADHGNVEMMIDPVTRQPHTAHTINPVPMIMIGKDRKNVQLRTKGALCDVIPTIFSTLEISPPSQMTGQDLIV